MWRFKVQGQKTCFEEHTEYVALEVNLSKSGWPTMYETLQVVLLHVFNIIFTFYASLVPRPEKRAWYTLSAHAPKCTENPGTSYISVKQSVNHRT